MLQEGERAGLVQYLACSSIQVRSLDLSSHLQLDSHRLRTTVSYPLLISAEPASSSYTYIQHMQHFPTSSVPPRWQPALRLALAAVQSSRLSAQSVHPTAEPAANESPPEQSWPRPDRQILPSSMAGPCDAAPLIVPLHGYSMPALSQAADQQSWGSECKDRGLALGPMPSRHMHGPEDLASDICHWPDPGSPTLHAAPRRPEGQSCGQTGRRCPCTTTSASRPAFQDGSSRTHDSIADACSFTELPVSGSLRSNDMDSLSFAELPWWRSNSAVVSPGGPPIQVEQTEEALYHCLPHVGEVHAWVSGAEAAHMKVLSECQGRPATLQSNLAQEAQRGQHQ